jgi:hypothetical protein
MTLGRQGMSATRATLRAVATIGGVHICSWPTVYEQHQEVGSIWTCSCGRRFVREDFHADDGRWLGAFFDLSPDSEPFEPFVPQNQGRAAMSLAANLGAGGADAADP